MRSALCDPALGSTGTFFIPSELIPQLSLLPLGDLQITIKEVLDITQTGEKENMKS